MFVFIYAQVVNEPVTVSEQPWVTELRSRPDWVTMDLDSFSVQTTVNLALRLLEQSLKGIVLIDVKSTDGSAIPFVPLMELANNAQSQVVILKQGHEHYLVDKVWATIPDANKLLEVTNDQWQDLVKID